MQVFGQKIFLPNFTHSLNCQIKTTHTATIYGTEDHKLSLGLVFQSIKSKEQPFRPGKDAQEKAVTQTKTELEKNDAFYAVNYRVILKKSLENFESAYVAPLKKKILVYNAVAGISVNAE